jgi:hypothetical protein
MESKRRKVKRTRLSPIHEGVAKDAGDADKARPIDVAKTWERDSRRTKLKGQMLDKSVRNPWGS